MLDHEPLPAPAPVFIRYLAAFHRFFTAVLDYSRAQDKAGMLLCGYLADALHNVPAMLWHCDSNRRLAELLLPLPSAMVRWRHFDESQFRKTLSEEAAS